VSLRRYIRNFLWPTSEVRAVVWEWNEWIVKRFWLGHWQSMKMKVYAFASDISAGISRTLTRILVLVEKQHPQSGRVIGASAESCKSRFTDKCRAQASEVTFSCNFYCCTQNRPYADTVHFSKKLERFVFPRCVIRWEYLGAFQDRWRRWWVFCYFIVWSITSRSRDLVKVVEHIRKGSEKK
jgi:hypothetical protein